MKTLIKNGNIHGYGIGDVVIENEKISFIGEVNDIKSFDKVIHADKKRVIPGLIDIHTHLREPGQERKETIQSGTSAAAKGGYTDVCCMPNTNPIIDTKHEVEYLKYKIKEDALVNVHIIGAITKGEKGEELAEIGKMAEAGIVAISDDGMPVTSSRMMKNAVMYASMFNVPVISHCEEADLIEEGQINEGYMATVLGLKGISPLAEEIMVSREIAIASNLLTHVHLAHISTKGSVELIRDAKKRGVKITAETCPHYFSLTSGEADGYNTYAKVNPPLREDEDVEAIIEGLIDGTLDCIATDHAPHAREDKDIEFNRAANGISGLETALSVGYTYLVKSDRITFEKLIDLMSKSPAKVLNLQGGDIKVGATANITIFDENSEWVVDGSKFFSKGHNTPYQGEKLYGVVTQTLVNGRLVYSK